MTSAITSPLHEEVIAATIGGDVMMGHDRDCARWIKRFRPAVAEGESAAGRRQGSRRRRG
jgi:5-methyltetrahydrofolate--homocysteine methyltransferase